MIIYGAGMAGLLAAHMLRRHKPIICEQAASLPHNHNALLRFRSDVVSRATGIPFKKVNVQKAICFEEKLVTAPDLKLSNLYAEKVTGKVQPRSILNLEPAERWIAPPDFVAQLAGSVEHQIRYNSPMTAEEIADCEGGSIQMVSTIPMPALGGMVGYIFNEEFKSRPITSIVAELPTDAVDVYQTIYYPGRETRVYRASLTGNRLTIELMGDDAGTQSCLNNAAAVVRDVLEDFGVYYTIADSITHHVQRYGKISPINDAARKSFILAMSDKYNIYSVGRFATWRQILLDDVVQDVERVARFIDERDMYKRRLTGDV